MEKLPEHLKKYVVEQNYEKYTPIDQAVWRYALRQLKSFLGVNAHESYLSGLEKTGVSIDEIPRISDISRKLENFGWRALPVSGFIPPAAFMELQSLSVLPIASDIRSLEHLQYTPAPDIIHEAAGHAPILAHQEFAQYLKEYSQVAKKSILSKDDIDTYEAIRNLSDLKENPSATSEQIQAAEKHLDNVVKNTSHISEASELSRMNWWTAEYGLIGSLENPKIFGAGLLSSVGEAKWCLDSKVKKIPLTVDCIKQSYDITEPQPQLFVTPDFKTLSKVLEDMASQMAFRKGGFEGLRKAFKAQTINTFEFESGLQVSGMICEVIEDHSQPLYIRTSGPTQLCFQDTELHGHSQKYHAQGFGTPVGKIKNFGPGFPTSWAGHSLNEISQKELTQKLTKGITIHWEFESGIHVNGTIDSLTFKNEQLILVSLSQAEASYKERILFDPSWGTYDMGIGSKITSVFGGPADRKSFGEVDDFVAARVPQAKWSESEKFRHRLYQEVRNLRNSTISSPELVKTLEKIYQEHLLLDPQLDWLLKLEMFEISSLRGASEMAKKLHQELLALTEKSSHLKELISDGLQLIKN